MARKPKIEPGARKRAVLDKWLEHVLAKLMWAADSLDGPDISSRIRSIQAYSINGKTVIVLDYGEHGWDIFVEACCSNKTAETLDAAGKLLGVSGCPTSFFEGTDKPT